MINTLSILFVAASLGIQPQVQDNRHEYVEILPSKTYVICAEDCGKPTPKKKRQVFRREISGQRNAYSQINDYLGNLPQGRPAPPADPFRSDRHFQNRDRNPSDMGRNVTAGHSPHPPEKMMAGRTNEEPVPHRRTPSESPSAGKPKTTYNVVFKKLTPDDIKALENNAKMEEKPGTNLKSNPVDTAAAGDETVYFDLNSSIITQEEKDKLEAWLISNKASRYKVSGYACPLSKEQRSMKLSENRAEAVRKIILEHKKDASVITQGMGSSEVFDQNTLKLNRRVTITALGGPSIKKTVTVIPKDTMSKKGEALKQYIRDSKGMAIIQEEQP